MQPEQFSETAIGIASVRAHHSLHDSPLVFDDPYAAMLLDEADRARAHRHLMALASAAGRARAETCDNAMAREGALLRANPFTGSALVAFRCADEWLREALDQGIEQCVVLGAGLDSTSLRFAEHAGPLRIFEVDHPATQRHKRRRMVERGLSPRSGTAFVEVDFHTTDLAAALRAGGFQDDRPAVFSWLNVIYYLRWNAVLRTFETIHEMAAPGSHVIFDVYETGVKRPTEERDADARMDALVRSLGEPPAEGHSAEGLRRALHTMGYAQVELVRPEEAEPWHQSARALGYGFISGSWVARARSHA